MSFVRGILGSKKWRAPTQIITEKTKQHNNYDPKKARMGHSRPISLTLGSTKNN
jgi:hypothetical protein